MARMRYPGEPLTEEELTRWAELGRACGMDSVDFMRGVFCAAATPANKLVPTDWMPLLLRTPPPSKQVLVEFTRFCFAEYSVCEQLLDLGAPDVPDADDVEAVRQFCRGYMVLARSDDRWFKENSVFLETFPIALLGGLVTKESIASFHPDCLTDPTWESGMREKLAERVASIARIWREKVPYVQAQLRSDKIGRNEPCPCGSGKKYKKCCAGDS
jgi:uncharacterized protein